MKKENFVALLVGVMGGVLFSLGMCMCLLPEWNAFTPGVWTAAAGAVTLLSLFVWRRIATGKPVIGKIDPKKAAPIALGVCGALVLGLGMSMVMVWEDLLIPGILVGLVGILLLLCLIPLTKGLH